MTATRLPMPVEQPAKALPPGEGVAAGARYRRRFRAATDPAYGLGMAARAASALYSDEARAGGVVSQERPVQHEHPAVAEARAIVRQRLGERIGLKEMADAAHVAPEHLVRLFRGRLGTTPVRYLWAARV